MATESGVYPVIEHIWICASNPWTSVEVIELPVFKPNPYFFEHHQKEGEEQWQTYARVIRDLMSEHSGIPI